jgi:hypothetical protein
MLESIGACVHRETSWLKSRGIFPENTGNINKLAKASQELSGDIETRSGICSVRRWGCIGPINDDDLDGIILAFDSQAEWLDRIDE